MYFYLLMNKDFYYEPALYEPSEANAAFCAKCESRESWGSRDSRKIPRSPRLAHKAPVMQANKTQHSFYYAT